MNEVKLVGNLKRDMDVRFTKTGKTVAMFTLAVSKGFDKDTNKERGTNFINCVVWGETAERASETLKKGSKCFVNGFLQVRDYETAEGQKRYVTEVVVNTIFPCGFLNKPENSFDSKGKEVNDDDIPF